MTDLELEISKAERQIRKLEKFVREMSPRALKEAKGRREILYQNVLMRILKEADYSRCTNYRFGEDITKESPLTHYARHLQVYLWRGKSEHQVMVCIRPTHPIDPRDSRALGQVVKYFEEYERLRDMFKDEPNVIVYPAKLGDG